MPENPWEQAHAAPLSELPIRHPDCCAAARLRLPSRLPGGKSMKNKNHFRAALAFFAATAATATAVNAAEPRTDDSDLHGTAKPFAIRNVPIELTPDEIISEDSPGPVILRFLRADHGTLVPMRALPIAVNRETVRTDANGGAVLPACSGDAMITVTLTDSSFSVTDGSQAYRITARVPCDRGSRLLFKEDSDAGQALGIWQIAELAKSKLAESTGLAFWSRPITFVWPAEGDYYSWGSVHLTRGDHWDVVGHEMGHAIYDLADIGQFGGGQHRIDECYSTSLALSEGWASYFAGWVRLGLDDADARFEYMVPRRAPIRFETIPEDVCQGETNEWRVIGFFWDLIDLHADGESGAEAFARVWQALAGSNVGSANGARKRLEAAGFDPALVQLIWELNFRK